MREYDGRNEENECGKIGLHKKWIRYAFVFIDHIQNGKYKPKN